MLRTDLLSGELLFEGFSRTYCPVATVSLSCYRRAAGRICLPLGTNVLCRLPDVWPAYRKGASNQFSPAQKPFVWRKCFGCSSNYLQRNHLSGRKDQLGTPISYSLFVILTSGSKRSLSNSTEGRFGTTKSSMLRKGIGGAARAPCLDHAGRYPR
uniref:Uncharacterized protein n=1 Tax=Aegilops tauschii subsp. strangulata TaxID=200361 RepID=A0A453JHL7_AEGTS